jgi:Fe-S oxidoreductase
LAAAASGPAVLAAIQAGDIDCSHQLIDLADSQGGVWRCHSAYECSEVCPSFVEPGWRIMDLRRLDIDKLGDEELFQKLAQSNIELFESRGVKKIITTSPHCLWTFTNEYPELGGAWEVIHYTSLVAQLQKEKLSFPRGNEKKVAFHDPCYLGRHSKVYDAPRELLSSVFRTEPLELGRDWESSLCCAGGGGRIWSEVPVGERFGEQRIKDALHVGAEILATSCPYCVNMLTDACKSLDQQDSLEVLELSEILVAALAE